MVSPTSPYAVNVSESRKENFISQEVPNIEPPIDETNFHENLTENEPNKCSTESKPDDKPVYDFVMLCDSNRKFININDSVILKTAK